MLPLNRTTILGMIVEEKEKYNTYHLSCSQYGIQPDPIAKAKCIARVEVLDQVLAMMQRSSP